LLAQVVHEKRWGGIEAAIVDSEDAAINLQNASCDISGVFGGEKDDCGGDFLGFPESAHGDFGGGCLTLLRGHGGEGWGVNVAGADGVHRDPGAGDFFGETLRESNDASLGCGVVGLSRWGKQRTEGGDIDDAAPALPHHRAGDGSAAVEGAGEIGVDDCLPGVISHHGEQLIVVVPGIVDEDIDGLICGEDDLDRERPGGGAGDI
jgi:hypothetical protein